MTTKRKPGKSLTDPAKEQKEAERIAGNALSPSIGAAVIVSEIYGGLDIMALHDQLADQCKAVHGGNLSRAESMLTAQAHSLNAIFTSMASRAAKNAGEYIQAAEIYLKLALRAQSQCRATLETLAAIKNPPNVAFVKQANIANTQQVNNGVANLQPSRTDETAIRPTELLGNDHGERLDIGATGTAGAGDPIMATVEAVHRPAHGAGEGHGEP